MSLKLKGLVLLITLILVYFWLGEFKKSEKRDTKLIWGRKLEFYNHLIGRSFIKKRFDPSKLELDLVVTKVGESSIYKIYENMFFIVRSDEDSDSYLLFCYNYLKDELIIWYNEDMFFKDQTFSLNDSSSHQERWQLLVKRALNISKLTKQNNRCESCK